MGLTWQFTLLLDDFIITSIKIKIVIDVFLMVQEQQSVRLWVDNIIVT